MNDSERWSQSSAESVSDNTSGAQARPRMVTLHAVLLALLLLPVNAYWVINMEVIRYSGHPTTISLFFNVVFILALLLIANGLLKRIAPHLAFAPGNCTHSPPITATIILLMPCRTGKALVLVRAVPHMMRCQPDFRPETSQKPN